MTSLKLALLTAFLLFTCQSSIAQSEVGLLVDKITAKSIIKGLPLEKHETTKSGNGRTKQWWKIVGAEYSSFEIIGDIQSDADLIGWDCAEFDADGNYVSPVHDTSFCRKFFILVLRNILSKPESAANNLLVKSKKIAPETAVREFGDISIETDGQHYFIRRKSRM